MRATLGYFIVPEKIRPRNELLVIEKLTSRLEETPVNVTSGESNFENNFAKRAFEKLSNYSQFFKNRIGPVEDSFWKWQIRRLGMASRKEKFQAESGVKRSSCRRQFANNHDDDRYLVRVMPVQLSLSMFVSCDGTCDDSFETTL